MAIIITKWALDSYLKLLHDNYYTKADYRQTIRPDVLRLNTNPPDTKLSVDKFWSLAGGIPDGYKMKWHNLGPGTVQLRLPVTHLGDYYLCAAYIKKNDQVEARHLAKFKDHIALIRAGRYIEKGRL